MIIRRRHTAIEKLVAEIDAVWARTPGRPWEYDGKYPMFIGYRHAVLRPYSSMLMFGTQGARRWDGKTGKVLEDDKIDAADAELTALLHNAWPALRRALLRKTKVPRP